MFGGFGSRFAKFGTGGGGRSIASAADLLQLFKRGSEDGAMLDELDNTTDLEFANVSCMEFDGSNDSVVYPHSQPFGNTLALSFYLKAPTPGSAKFFLTKYESSGNRRAFYLKTETNGKISLTVSNNGSSTQLNVSQSNSVVLDDQLHHIQYLFTDSGYYLYIDGVLDKYSSVSQTLVPHSSDARIGLGCLLNGSTSQYAQGIFGGLKMCGHEDELDVYLLVGQSNMVGDATTYGSLPTILQGRNVHLAEISVELLYGITDEVLKPVSGTKWGMELTAGQKLFAKSNRRALFIKVAKGGSNMHTDWQQGGEMYNDLIAKYNVAKANVEADGYTLGNHRLVIMQGEADAGITANAQAWESNYDQMISDVQSDLGISIGQQVICRISDNYAGTTPGDIVRAAQDKIGSRTGNVLIDTDNISVRADNIHYDADGLQELGNLVGEALEFSHITNDCSIHVPSQEGSGTTSYDVTGAGNHGLITGATWTTEDGIESWNHEYGFTDDSGVKVPALNTKTTQVATFDGVADEVNFGTHAIPASDSIEVVFTPQDKAIGRGILYSQGSFAGSFGYAITWDGNSDRISASSKGSGTVLPLTTATNSCVADGTTYKVTYTYDSSAGTITLVLFNNDTGATIQTVSETGLDANKFNTGASRPVKVGEDQVGFDDYLGTIHSVKSSFIDIDFQTNIGTTTVLDNSGNGNNGTVTVGAGGTDSFWGTRVADTSGLIVSADYATGNLTISNLPALDNGAEADLVQTDSVFTSGTTSFWSADGATQDEKTFAQLIDHANNRNGYNRIWVKVVDGRIICIAQYDLDKDFLPSDVLKNERYFGGTSGALRDVNGDLIVDGSGFAIFAA